MRRRAQWPARGRASPDRDRRSARVRLRRLLRDRYVDTCVLENEIFSGTDFTPLGVAPAEGGGWLCAAIWEFINSRFLRASFAFRFCGAAGSRRRMLDETAQLLCLSYRRRTGGAEATFDNSLQAARHRDRRDDDARTRGARGSIVTAIRNVSLDCGMLPTAKSGNCGWRRRPCVCSVSTAPLPAVRLNLGPATYQR